MGHGLAMILAAVLATTPQEEVELSAVAHREAVERFRIGELLMEREEYEAAVRELHAALDLAPRFLTARYRLGEALMALRRYPEASEAFSRCRDDILRQGPQDLLLEERIHTYQGILEPRDDVKRDRSMRRTLRMMELAERSGEGRVRVPAELSLALGSSLYRQGRLEEAGRAYREAIAADPGLGEAHNNLAVVLMLTGRFDDARAEIRAAERAGFRVDPRFEQDLESRAREASVR